MLLSARAFVFGDACVRAGVIAWGVQGANACPAGSYVIVDEAQCQAAAKTAGKVWGGSVSGSSFPHGCFGTRIDDNVYYNPHPTGGTSSGWSPLCAVGAAGASGCVRVCARARVRVSARAHGVCYAHH